MTDAPSPARPAETATSTGPTAGPDRRTLVRGAALLGAGGLSLPLLSACGPIGGEETKAEKPASGTAIAATSDVPVGGGVILRDPGIVLTQPTEGTFKGFSPICPHQGCNVATVEDGEIDCPCHGSRFSIEDGSVKQGPAENGLEQIAVTVKGSQIVGA